MSPPLHIEGTTLEGGGQILRLAVGLSALTKTPIRITNIRGKRHGGGGLKAQHLTGVEFLGRKSGALMKGVGLKSQEIEFGFPSKQVGLESKMEGLKLEENGEEEIWDIRQDTPGSVNLVFQAVLPYVLFSGSTKKIRLRIQGGTNVSNSPSFEYVDQVLLPMLEKIGIPIEARLLERGWSTAGRDRATTLGRVEYVITPLSQPLPGFQLLGRGEVVHVQATILAPKSVERQFREILEDVLDRYRPQIFGPDDAGEIPVETTFEDSGHLKRYYLLLVATTSTGMKLGRDWLYDAGFKRSGVEDAVTKRVCNKVVMDFAREMQHGGCVDEFARDQLVVFQGLAEGKSEVFGGKMGGKLMAPSLHAETAQWVVNRMLGVEFDEGGGCTGVGYVPGSEWVREEKKEGGI